MNVLTALGFVADFAIIYTYARLAQTGKAREFHWANAIGCVPLLVGEILVGAWPPFVLTAFFGLFGWIGVLKSEWEDELP